MPASRRLLTWILVLAALGLAVPAATLAAGGGGSAGDQQYTDPFAGTSTPSSTHTATTPAPTTTAAATTPAPAPPDTATTPAPAPAAASADSAPATATTARPTTLAFTGYDSWLAAGLGAAMIGGGVLLRRRVRRA